jgi:hypothetical protein
MFFDYNFAELNPCQPSFEYKLSFLWIHQISRLPVISPCQFSCVGSFNLESFGFWI